MTASNRGKGTGIFQWLLTLGIVTAALVGVYFSSAWTRSRSSATLPDSGLQRHRVAWHFLGLVASRHSVCDWQLHGRGVAALAACGAARKRLPIAALLRSRTTEQADLELKEMQEVIAAGKGKTLPGAKASESLLRRKYVIPFVLACIILACNQTTGINSIIAYNTNILLQSGLSDVAAHWGYVVFTIINFLVTFGGVVLVDRKGRKFLSGHRHGRNHRVADLHRRPLPRNREPAHRCEETRSSRWSLPDQKLDLLYNEELAGKLLDSAGDNSRSRIVQLRWS